MNIALQPETERLLEERMSGGAYPTADALVRAALLALEELESHHLDDETLDAIDRAEDQIERGEHHDWNEVRGQVRDKFLGK